MTDNEIIKALECCSKGAECNECPFHERKEDCEVELPEEALDLIDRQKEEINALIAGQETLQKHIIAQKAEIKSLADDNAFLERHLKLAEDLAITAKTKAIKEFAERSKKMISVSGRRKDYFDNLVKEMAGDE